MKSEFELRLAVSKAQSDSGGCWSAALMLLDSGKRICVDDTPMQAASLIKLYIMGAVYECYDSLFLVEPKLDEYLSEMITVSDNVCANRLVELLGGGSTAEGKRIVTEYCRKEGYSNSLMGRLLLEEALNGDNFTSAGDCVFFLSRVYGGELPHSEKMLNLLMRQKLTSKIPSGVPKEIQTANKTGELERVQNDAAIVFTKNPYILCVMAENVEEDSAVSSIREISSRVYALLNN